jgi:glyoxylase-like metal-dependent hydrolase (beta-lactamase superfamily II)
MRVGDWELFSLLVFETSDEVMSRHSSDLTDDFPSTTYGDWMPFRAQYPMMFMAPLDAQNNHSRIHSNVFLLRRPNMTVLIDTGVGELPPELKIEFVLPRELEHAGIRREDIDLVVLSHVHPDHIGWACEDRKPTFSKARYVLSKTDFEHLQATDEERFERLIKPLESAGQLELLTGGAVLEPDLEIVPSPGHTPGHVTVRTEDIIIASDVFHQPAQVTHPEWIAKADWNGTLAAKTRVETLQNALETEALLCITHCIDGGIGRIIEQSGKLRWSAL